MASQSERRAGNDTKTTAIVVSACGRVTIPFDGDINPATVKGNVFFVSLGDTTDNWTDDGPDSVSSVALTSFTTQSVAYLHFKTHAMRDSELGFW